MKIAYLLTGLLALLMMANTPSANETKKGAFTPIDQPPPSAQQVIVGFYPISIYELDMSSNTYYIDTYMWMKWNGEIDPTATVEFTNMVAEWDKLQENLNENPIQKPDGSKYQIMRVEGRFVQPFNLTNYPLDEQQLSIMIEDTVNGVDTLSYLIDEDQTGIGQTLQIPGWKMKDWTSQAFAHDYGTQFGDESGASTYSALQFNINISRPLSFFYWKLLFPLFVVLASGMAALFLNAGNIDSRASLPVGALLTAVFLQKTYSDGLPDLGYLILMDKIYLVAYALIVITLVRVITVYGKAHTADEKTIAGIHATDRVLMVLQMLVFIGSTTAFILLR